LPYNYHPAGIELLSAHSFARTARRAFWVCLHLRCTRERDQYTATSHPLPATSRPGYAVP